MTSPLVRLLWTAACTAWLATGATAAPPPEVQLPGSQPPETRPVGQDPLLEILVHDTQPNSPGYRDCSQCHTSGEDPAPEDRANSILNSWSGGMMAHASRDPVTWAQLAIVEQDVAGAGDLCLRCHVPVGWSAGRSAQSDGSMLLESDADGITCHLCHRMANPDDGEMLGEQAAPYVANRPDPEDPESIEGYYGNAMYVLYQDGASTEDISRLGPYADPVSPHPTLQSTFHRDPDFCGTCHDVSNPLVGDLAPSHGALLGNALAPDRFSGDLADDDVSSKAGFRNPPYAYGTEQRTFSEYKASPFPTFRVSDFDLFPEDLKVEGGSPRLAYEAALAAGTGGDYADGAMRTFTCQTCHMRPATAMGCNLPNRPNRPDMPVHDLTGANYWGSHAVAYLDAVDKLHLGSGLSDAQTDAMSVARARTLETLRSAVTLKMVDGDSENLTGTLRVTNLTGHKLPSGYPDGKRMWLNLRWYDASGALLREDGAYGEIELTPPLEVDGQTLTRVRTLLDRGGSNTRIYEMVLGISRDWAVRTVADAESGGLAIAAGTPLAFDRATGQVEMTLGEIASQNPGAVHESFRLILNDTVLSDTRIPPYRMDYAKARVRNALPVPETLYLAEGVNPETGSVYQNFDDLPLDPPSDAVRASVRLLYQPISWEYVQFLHLANAQPEGSALATVGVDLLEAWEATGMAEPIAIATLQLAEPAAEGLAAAALGVLAGLGRLKRSRRRR